MRNKRFKKLYISLSLSLDFSILLGGYELNETLFSLLVTMADERRAMGSRTCKFLTILDFTHNCREFVDVAIYALCPESFCLKNPAVRKVLVFSDSGKDATRIKMQRG